MSDTKSISTNQFQLLHGHVFKGKSMPKFYVKRLMQKVKLRDMQTITDGEIGNNCNSTIRVIGGNYVTTGDSQFVIWNPETKEITQVETPVSCRVYN